MFRFLSQYRHSIAVVSVSAAIWVGVISPVYGLSFNPVTGDQTGLIDKTNANINTALGLGTTAPTLVVLNLINLGLSLLGTVSVILLVYGGFLWVWARGNEETIDRAKEIIRGTIIGLIIVFAALGITRYVFINVGNISGATVITTS